MENTIQAKQRFFAQYYGQKLLINFGSKCVVNKLEQIISNDYLQLTPLSNITDEDAIQVARLAHELPNAHFEVNRVDGELIHLTHFQSNISLEKHISINKYGYINANWHFKKTEDDEAKSFKVNIGEVQVSSKRPIPYISIVDYLRSKGYALPWMGLSVEQQIEYGWITLKH